MMMVSNISIFGGMCPKFGGARLPNDQGALQRPATNEALICDRKRQACRLVRRSFRYVWLLDKLWSGVGAGDPASAASGGPSFLIVARDSVSTAAQLSPQRLGAFRGFGLMPGQHPSRLPGKPHSRSGASPHRSSDGGSPLMTITKIFVTYLKHPIVSL